MASLPSLSSSSSSGAAPAAAAATDGYGQAAAVAQELYRLDQQEPGIADQLRALEKLLGDQSFEEITRAAHMRANIAQNDMDRDIAYIEIMKQVIKVAGEKGFDIHEAMRIVHHCNIASQTSGSKRSLQDTFATHSSGSTASTLDPNKNLTDKMREALISFFQNFYDTKEISGLREFFETQLTSTKAQMTLTGRFGPVDSTADFLSPLLSVKFNHEFKTNGGNEKAAFQKVLKDFKQSYSWLSSVRMDTYKDGKPKHNQDEHALPFLFMLLFGGGIASVPFKNPYEHSEIAEYWKTYVQLVAKEDRNDEEDKKMKDALESVEAHMSTITESGGDPCFILRLLTLFHLY